MNTKLDQAMRLINVVCGEPHGDGMTVTDIGVGYAEPGYHDDETVWAFGDWNDTADSNLPSRLFDALERIGVQGEWLDEWTRCSHCYRAVRTSGDSYSWQPYYVIVNECEPLCGDCARDPEWIAAVLAEFVNESDRCVTLFGEDVLTGQGWSRFNVSPYEAGWHPGQTANPRDIAALVGEAMPNHDWLFVLDENSQFYSSFSIFTRPQAGE